MNKSIDKSKLAPVSRWARLFHTDSLWFKKHVEGQGYHSALLELSKIQRSCSMATNLALNEVLRSLRQDSKSQSVLKSLIAQAMNSTSLVL
jgi:hypothetical protein